MRDTDQERPGDLLDLFAGLAMAGLLASGEKRINRSGRERLAREARAYAAAMMRMRERDDDGDEER